MSTEKPINGNAGLELAVVVPTFNESENIINLVEAVQETLDGYAIEIIVVDDHSPDGTADRVRELAQRNIRVRCIERFGRRGLSSAFVEGALSTAASVVAIIDGDMQHDEKLLPLMLKQLRCHDLDMVIGSRYLDRDGVEDWTKNRIRASKAATFLARRLTGVQLTDPMSGFFMIRTELLRSLTPKLSAIGFKILLDIFLSAPVTPRFVELPYRFGSRRSGKSKMDAKVILEFGELLIDKLVGHILPAKLVLFSLVGSIGVLVHLVVLALFFKGLAASFQVAQIVATLVAMTSNFTLNNSLTYHDRQLSGWAWIKGWIGFSIVSSVGVVSNVGVATVLFRDYDVQWIASALGGILVGLVWNYVLTSIFVWRA